MRSRLAFAICSAVLLISIGCSQADQEKARERAAEAKQKARREAERLRADAQKLGRNFSEAVNDKAPAARDATQTAQEKLQNGARELRVESGKAAVKLNHAALVAKVKAKLAQDVGLSTVTSVDVDASGRVVTLRGTVSSEQQRQQAEQSVSQISGITKVIDDLQIRP